MSRRHRVRLVLGVAMVIACYALLPGVPKPQRLVSGAGEAGGILQQPAAPAGAPAPAAERRAPVYAAAPARRGPVPPVAETRGSDGDTNYDEAADWERMNDEEREAAGLTRTALYGSSQGGRWRLVAFMLEEQGQQELAAATTALSDALWSADVKSPLGHDLVDEERALLRRIDAMQLADPLFAEQLSKLRTRAAGYADGSWPDVDTKVRRERETATAGHSHRDKDVEDDAEQKRARRHAANDASQMGAAGATPPPERR